MIKILNLLILCAAQKLFYNITLLILPLLLGLFILPMYVLDHWRNCGYSEKQTLKFLKQDLSNN